MTEIKQCEVCHIGTMHPMKAAYSTWVNHQLVLVPNIEAWVCDVCGDFWHEPERVSRIEMLLGNKPGGSRADRHLQHGSDQNAYPIPSTDRSRSV